jgi:prohibitin 1
MAKDNLIPAIIIVGIIVLATALLIGSLMGFGIFTIVAAGQVGVQDTFGNVDSSVLNSGIHFKAPWTNIVALSTQTEKIDLIGDTEATSLTSEGLTVEIDASTLYHIDYAKAPDIYKSIGTDYEEKVVIPEVRGALRTEIARYRAEDIYSQERGQIARSVVDNLNAKLNPRGIYVDDFIIRRVLLPEQLSQAIQSKQTAEQQIKQKEYQVDVEKMEAERKRQEAQGIADANRIIANSLSDNYLRWYWIDKIAQGNNTIYVPSDGFQLVKAI